MKRIGILTGGGDAPGLNAVIRAAVMTGIRAYHCEVLGIKDGFDGFISEDGIFPLTLETVRGILPRGGTILGTANRGNPFARKVERDGKTVVEDTSDLIVERIQAMRFDALIVVGGDGTLHIANKLCQRGVPAVGVPKTIDNDIGGTDFTFGFDTALNIAMEALDRLHSTAEAHHRAMLLELMGRDAGFITLHAGLAGGADVILIPEIPFRYESVCRKVTERARQGLKFSILAVSEGSRPQGEEQVYSRPGDQIYTPRLGGIAERVSAAITQNCGVESRVTVLGHLQRGGSPTGFDRWLSTQFGAEAMRLAVQGGFGRMVALRGGEIVDVSLEEALAVPKRVDVNGDSVRTARDIGVSFGDD